VGKKKTAPPALTWLPIDTVEAWDKNPRKNAHAVQPVARSIARFGFASPAVVWAGKGQLVAGHTRLAAVRWLQGNRLVDGAWEARPADDPYHVVAGYDADGAPILAPGADMVPVRMQPFSDEHEAAAFALADNKLGELADWDDDGLSAILADLGNIDVELDALGWSAAELAALVAPPPTPGPPAPSPPLPGADERHAPTLHLGDCVQVLAALPDGCIDAVVTDPPYEIGFMGRKWDAEGTVDVPALARELLRVMKPGAHLVWFGATRRIHRHVGALEDEGFEVRDLIGWLHWAAFPGGRAIDLGIDEHLGAERPVVGVRPQRANTAKANVAFNTSTGPVENVTAPATPQAAAWAGWNTRLRPCLEPCALLRAPLDGGDGGVVGNVMRWGTGALNIDATRHAPGDDLWPGPQDVGPRKTVTVVGDVRVDSVGGGNVREWRPLHPGGRYPANVVQCPRVAGKGRDWGMDGEAITEGTGVGALRDGGRGQSTARNNWPTVKPIALMRHLVRLVTPPGGTVLDPFMGSGSTGIAAIAEGARFVGVDNDADAHRIATARTAAALRK